ncbi:MAG TPA: matrixin family metalloprotease [Terrimicrobiaceae bacterium]|nr:matrixin family metalloprotease [Terrimicrobiaceae bacterium]
MPQRLLNTCWKWTGFAGAAFFAVLVVPPLAAFVFILNYPVDAAPKWPAGSIKFLLDFPNPATSPMSDGETTFYPVFADAVASWDGQIASLSMQTAKQVGASQDMGNGLNVVWFDNDMYGKSFGTGVLAVTYTFWTETETSRTIIETKMIFNNAWTWDSYRGQLKGSGEDFKRVALHELGHALGLSHPDQYGQSVDAIMNAKVSDLDALQQDDKDGIRTLYTATGPSGGIPPGGEGTPRLDSGPKGLGPIGSAAGSGAGIMNYTPPESEAATRKEAPLIQTSSPAQGTLLVESGSPRFALEGAIEGSGKYYGLQASSDGGLTWKYLPGYDARKRTFSTEIAMPPRGESQTLLLRAAGLRSEFSAVRTLIFRRSL